MTKYYQCPVCRLKLHTKQKMRDHMNLGCTKVELAQQIAKSINEENDAIKMVDVPKTLVWWDQAADYALNTALTAALKPMFSKRHYKRIAELISTLTDITVRDQVTAKFAAMLADDNPAFQPDTFWKAVEKGGK